jgi:prolyl-tRNA editing enzyme YbaK/EbsC (Cys-tRNA(Pro) deacylase)
MSNDRENTNFPLRLPQSSKNAVEQIAREYGTSVSQIVVTTEVAEKVSALNTAEFLAHRKSRADFEAFDRIFGRKAAQEPAVEDTFEGSHHEDRF